MFRLNHHGIVNKGYTMVELATIIAIIGVLSVMAAPRFFSTIIYQRQVYYDEVLNTVRYARKLAVGSGSHIQVSVTNNSIALQRRIEGASCAAATFTAITDPTFGASGYNKIAPTNVTLNFSSDWPIYFNGLGQALRASDCSIINTDTIGVVGGKTVTLVGQTGFVE